jgi:two-component system sensor histidine kinase YesM
MIFDDIATKYRSISLFRKMTIMFVAVFIIAIALITLVFWTGYRNLVNAEMGAMARRNSRLIAGSIDGMINTASYDSKLLLSNATIQQRLKGNANLGNVYTMHELEVVLSGFMNITPHASAIYLFDTHGRKFGVDYYSVHDFPFDRIEAADWYRDVLARNGFYVLLVNAGDNKPLNGSQNVITLVRSVYDLDEASRLIGTIMLNLKESVLTGCFADMTGEGELFATVVDGSFNPVLTTGNEFLSSLDPDKYGALLAGNDRETVEVDQGRKLFFSAHRIKNADWYVVTAMTYAENATPLSGIDRMYWLFILCMAFLLFAAAAIINRLFTAPIRQLTEAMKDVGLGDFRKVEMQTGHDEIGLLKDTYNAMIGQIESLVERIRDEGERKRVAELHALQMQVKPHFLYNTIDTARSLILSGQAQEANVLLRTLGQFYRNSISGDRDVITLGEEIDMAKNYLVIQKIRYGDLFETEYDIDGSLLDAPMLKLVVQPLVENSIYHGIKPAQRKGLISLRAWSENGDMLISVADDGIGMTDEKLASILCREKTAQDGEQIGLCGTIDRLRLFTGTQTPLDIESRTGSGTRVTVRIPLGGAK